MRSYMISPQRRAATVAYSISAAAATHLLLQGYLAAHPRPRHQEELKLWLKQLPHLLLQ